MKKTNLLSLAVGSVVAVSAVGQALAEASNPFSALPLDKGYQVAQSDKKADGKCGEGKCGAGMSSEKSDEKADKKAEAKCGADKKAEGDKKPEGRCGAKHGDKH